MERMKIVDLKALAKEHGLRGYSKFRKAELITFLQNNLQPTPAPPIRPPRPTRPPPPPPAWEPINDKPRPTPKPRPVPSPKPIPAPGPRPIPAPRRRPIPAPRPRPPPRPYQLKPKRGKETFVEPSVEQKELPPSNLKQIKRMKKKLGKLNKKIRHSKRKHSNLISKRNSIKKKIEELKGPREHEGSFNPIELEQAFNRSYRISEKNTNTGNELNERETRISLIEDQTVSKHMR